MPQTPGRARAWIGNAVDRGASCIVSLTWDPEAKVWAIVASYHEANRVRVIVEKADTTVGIGVPEVKAIAGAIRRECESWLF